MAETPAKRTPKFFPGIDLLRAIAAMLVVVNHIRNLFFMDYAEVVHKSWLVKSSYFVTGLGHQSVIIFFVLSGLLVGGKVVETMQSGSWSWVQYLIERGTRLCIVLWPALVLTFCWDYLGNQLFDFARAYAIAPLGDNVIPLDMAAASTLRVYLSNAFFLQGILAPSAGTNGSLWSLSNEFWYYLAFPAILLSWSSRVSLRNKGISLFILFVSLGIVQRGGMKEGFAIWLLGVVAARLGRRLSSERGGRLVAGVAVGLLIVALSVARSRLVPHADYLIGLATALLGLAILRLPSNQNGPISKTASFFSSFSYTLYLTHLPFLVFLRAWLKATPRWQPDLTSAAWAAAFCLAATVWAYLVFRVTEAHTPQLRQFLTRRFVKPETAQPQERKSKAA